MKFLRAAFFLYSLLAISAHAGAFDRAWDDRSHPLHFLQNYLDDQLKSWRANNAPRLEKMVYYIEVAGIVARVRSLTD